MVEPVPTPKREAFAHVNEAGQPKLRFPRRRDAKAAARRFWSQFSQRLWPYRCSSCDGWHLSHTPRRPQETES